MNTLYPFRFNPAGKREGKKPLKPKAKKILLFFSIILTITGGAGYLILRGYFYPIAIQAAEQFIEKKTGGKAKIGSVSIDLLPLSLSLRDVHFSLADDMKAELEVKKVRAVLNLVQAFSGTILIQRVEVIEPHLDISIGTDPGKAFSRRYRAEQTEKPGFFKVDVGAVLVEGGQTRLSLATMGEFSLDGIFFNYIKAGPEGAAMTLKVEETAIAIEKISEEISRLEVDALLSDKALTIRNLKGLVGGKFVSGNLTADLANRAVKGTLSGQLPLSRIAHYTGKKLSGTAGFSSTFTVDGKGRIRADADIGMSSGEIEGIGIEKFKASLLFENNALTVNELQFSALGGMGIFKGTVSPAEGPFDFSFRFSELTLPPPGGKKIASLPSGRFSGRATGKGNLKTGILEGVFDIEAAPLPGAGGEETVYPVTFEGGVRLEKGEIELTEGTIRGDRTAGRFAGRIVPKKNLSVEIDLTAADLSRFSGIFRTRMEGAADLNLRLYGKTREPSLDVKVDGRNLRYADYRVKKIRGGIGWVAPRLIFKALEIEGESSAVALEGSVALGAGARKADIEVALRRGDLAEIVEMAGKDYPLEGGVTGHVRVEGDLPENVAISGNLDLRKGVFFGEAVDRISLEGSFRDKRLELKRFDVRKGLAYLRGRGVFPLSGDISLEVGLDNLDLRRIDVLRSRFSKIQGVVDFEGGVGGTKETPRLQGKLRVTQLGWDESDLFIDLSSGLESAIEIKQPEKSALMLNIESFDASVIGSRYAAVSPFGLHYDGGSFAVRDLVLEGPGGKLGLSGTMDKNRRLDFSLKGAADIGGLEKKLPPVEMIGGTVRLDAHVGGDLKAPEVSASLQTDDGRVRFVGFPYDLTSIAGKVALTHQKILIEEIKGALQGTAFTGGGEIVLENLKFGSFNIFVDIGEVDLLYPKWLPSRSRGRITVGGSTSGVTLGGDIEIIRASYTENIEINKMIADAIELGRIKTVKKPASDEKVENKEGGLSINMHFRADDNLIVKNNIADVELKGDLNLVGKTDSLALIGELETIGGKTNFRNRPFTIVKGTVNFSDRDRIVPRFDMTAETDVKNYHVNLNVSGTPQRHTVTLKSDPPLDDSELAALVAFGYTKGDTEMTSIGAASLLIQEELEGKFKKYFGFDRFQIDPYYSETSGSTEARVTVGKEIRKNVSASYSRGLSNVQDEEVKLEYRLDNNVSVEGSWASTEENIGSFGGDLIYRFEFE